MVPRFIPGVVVARIVDSVVEVISYVDTNRLLLFSCSSFDDVTNIGVGIAVVRSDKDDLIEFSLEATGLVTSL